MEGYNSAGNSGKGAYFEEMMVRKTETYERGQNQKLNL